MLAYEGIAEKLTDRVPELGDRTAERFEEFRDDETGGLLAYPVFGDVFQPFLFRLLDENRVGEVMVRTFAFLEEMAESTDRAVYDLLGIEVLEPLLHDPKRLLLAWPHMKVKMREQIRETAGFQGVERNVSAE
ncbi:MAG: hypothetical protein WA823_16630 [Candidatus Acidiferrales bacterium]